ncbi:MAG: hypothetical protein ACE5HE_00305 [Phycisphaerae bacterium]
MMQKYPPQFADQEINPTDAMPFGKHKGLAMAQVPVGYLKILLRSWENRAHNLHIFIQSMEAQLSESKAEVVNGFPQAPASEAGDTEVPF